MLVAGTGSIAVTKTLISLLELHAASAALQRAHRAAVDNGDTALAAETLDLGERVAKAIGGLVVREAQRNRLRAVGS